jgi:hypothetical protein
MPKQFQCDQCENSYAHINGLKRHQKAVHSLSREISNVTTTKTCDINAPVSINLNFFGQENLDHIKNDTHFLTKCLQEVNLNGIPDLLERIHLNPSVPENNNVKLKREHAPKIVFVYDKEKDGWTLMLADDIVHVMIEKAVQILCFHKNETSHIDDAFDAHIEAIKKRARGSIYIPIRDTVMMKLRKHKNKSAHLESSLH